MDDYRGSWDRHYEIKKYLRRNSDGERMSLSPCLISQEKRGGKGGASAVGVSFHRARAAAPFIRIYRAAIFRFIKGPNRCPLHGPPTVLHAARNEMCINQIAGGQGGSKRPRTLSSLFPPPSFVFLRPREIDAKKTRTGSAY